MVTTRQKRLAKNLIENTRRAKPLNKKELVVLSGYGEISAKSSAHLIIEQKGVKEALNDYGFNEESAKKVVGEILTNKVAQDKDRLKAADMVFDVHGSKAPTKHMSVNVDLTERVYIESITEKVISQMREDEQERTL